MNNLMCDVHQRRPETMNYIMLNRSSVRLMVRFVLFCLCMITSTRSWATCSAPPEVDVTFPAFTINGGNPTPIHDPSINNTLTWSSEARAPQDVLFDTCSVSPVTSVVWGTGNIVSGASYTDEYGTYPVFDIPSIPGVGYIIRARAEVTDWITVSPEEKTIRTIPSGSSNTRLYFQIRLIAYGIIPAGNYTFPTTTVGYWALRDANGQSVPGLSDIPISLSSTTVIANTIGCTVTSPPAQTATLPLAVKGDFSGVGSSPAQTANFQFSLNCPDGISLFATMSDAMSPASTDNTLKLTADSTARGVGIQIFRDGESTPVSFGPDSPVAGNINQWYIGESSGQNSFVLPFDARYVQTGDSITSGTVNSIATITFSYQ